METNWNDILKDIDKITLVDYEEVKRNNLLSEYRTYKFDSKSEKTEDILYSIHEWLANSGDVYVLSDNLNIIKMVESHSSPKEGETPIPITMINPNTAQPTIVMGIPKYRYGFSLRIKE
jgi:hypothetical protein